MEKGQADLVRLQFTRGAVEHVHGEKAFFLGLIDRCALIQLFQDTPELFRRLVPLQAYLAFMSTVWVQIGYAVLAVIIGEAVQSVSDHEFWRDFFPLENHFMTGQMAKGKGFSIVLEAFPDLNGIYLILLQARSSSTG